MFLLSLSKISYITKSILVGKDIYINNISVDTRLKNIENSLFIIIKGNNSIEYLCNEAIKKGALAILSEYYFFIDIPQLIVKNSYFALSNIVSWLRKKNNTKFISLTGTTGKTTVKEITSNILKNSGKTLYNYSNWNSGLGVLYTLLNLYQCIYKYSVLELGADSIKDIDYISNIVKPDIVGITNISISHLNSFKNFFNIVKCKGKIFKNLSSSGLILLNHNYFLNKFWKKYFLNRDKFFISYIPIRKSNYISICNYNINLWGSNFTLITDSGIINIYTKLLGIHNIWNCLFSSALSFLSGANLKDIKIGIENFNPIKGRLYPIYLNKNKLIIDDTYNSNPRSLYYSILFLKKCLGYRILVVGDMAELNFMSLYYHIKIGKLLKDFLFVDEVLSFGINSFYISKYSFKGIHFLNIKNLVLYLKKIFKNYSDVTVLIKGSRFLGMEKIINFF